MDLGPIARRGWTLSMLTKWSLASLRERLGQEEEKRTESFVVQDEFMLRNCNLTAHERVVYKMDINITGSWESLHRLARLYLPHGCTRFVVIVR